MTNMIHSLLSKVHDQKGQGLVEYALIIVLVSVALVAALTTLSGEIGSVFTTIGNSFPA